MGARLMVKRNTLWQRNSDGRVCTVADIQATPDTMKGKGEVYIILHSEGFKMPIQETHSSFLKDYKPYKRTDD